MAHLTDDEVEGFLAGNLGNDQRSRLIHHLLKGCDICRSKLVEAFPEVSSSDVEDPAEEWLQEDYEQVIDRALATIPSHQSRWKREKKRLTQALSVLQTHSPSLRGGSLDLEQVRKYRGRPLVEALLQLSLDARYQDLELMKRLASEARDVAESLTEADHDAEEIFDLQARAWAELANACRVNDELDQAETTLAKAYSLQQQGTGDLLLFGRLADIKASLRRSQRRIKEACALLEETHHLYFSLGEDHLAGRALVSHGICLRAGDHPQEAVQSLQAGLALLEPERDPQLVAVAHQALLDATVDCGDFRRAAEILMESGLRQAFASDPLNLLRLRWMEGKILAGLGKLSRAEEVLCQVRAEFQQRGLQYDAALAGLDLAEVWLSQGREEELHLLAEEMIDTFLELEIHPEAIKALRFW